MTINVLVVDDTSTVREALTADLTAAGMTVDLACDGREALDRLGPGHGFDVIISDLMMPGIDGLTLVNTIQKSGQLRMIPVLIVTSSEDTDDHIQNLEAGAAVFMVKPWNKDVLIAHVRRLAAQKQRHTSLERASRTDPLTGLSNRRHGLARLDEEMLRSRRYNRPLAVVLLDIDHFKRVNDTLGHAAGDDVLRQVGSRLRGISRSTDVVVRWGGEEFVFIFPETTLEEAAGIMDRFRENLAERGVTLTVGEGLDLPVTISGGVAVLEDGDTSDSLVDRVDQALYGAKEGGRNQLLMWQRGQLRPVVSA